ncbi:MAG TPA: helix-turn-helix domain-containing protein [Candidatus Eisenbacteria bacterium]|nr:helix-turn-helix domain-containing protein [Candidatus Eisenbacteria bacterium]
MEQTRQRITRAAVELHGTIGPAATTMSVVADRAGVTRATLYRHFPNQAALLAACSVDWLAANPRPDPETWREIANPADRLRAGLDELYAYYRSTERMRANLLRDIELLPQGIRTGITAFPASVVPVLQAGWPDARLADLRRAAIGHAVAFETWRSLVGQDLSDSEAAGLMVRFVTSVV